MTKYLTCNLCGDKFRRDEAPRIGGRSVSVCQKCRAGLEDFGGET